MSHLFTSLRASASFPAPTCRTCLRLAALPFPAPVTEPAHTRGKKKKPVRDPKQITVRLETDVPGVGRKGAYVPTTRGEMRNAWFVEGTASYVAPAVQQALRRERVPVARDVLFLAAQGKLSKRRQAAVDRAVRAGGQVTVAEEQIDAGILVEKVEPRRAMELVAALVPDELTFARQVQSEETGMLFGSVTSADVAAAVVEALAGDAEASRVLVAEEDVHFVDVKGDDGNNAASNRVKALGRFTVEIKVKGAESGITRRVSVVSQDTTQKSVAN